MWCVGVFIMENNLNNVGTANAKEISTSELDAIVEEAK